MKNAELFISNWIRSANSQSNPLSAGRLSPDKSGFGSAIFSELPQDLRQGWGPVLLLRRDEHAGATSA